MAQADDIRTNNAVAAKLEEIAATLEKLMPLVNNLRDAVSEAMPGAARLAGFEGSAERLDQAAAEGLGLGRIERARKRIAAAVFSLEDQIPRPGE